MGYFSNEDIQKSKQKPDPYKKLEHSGEWITEEDVLYYRKLLKDRRIQIDEDIGEFREIRLRFRARYDLNELESINLLKGYNTELIIGKYDRMRSGYSIKSSNVKERGDE